ncbi:MAG TPA: hypothetical protein VIB11_04150 [Pedococcus sp.]|uniref:hypothetical protein n=1 Tax=Pedococcus sp. TaxID=2860345 RepID=UPI002F92C847
MRLRAPQRYAVGLVLAALVAACTGQGSAEGRSAVAAALSFGASASTAPTKACGLLAPGTREDLEGAEPGSCSRLLPAQGLPESSAARDVEVFGKDAIVRLDRDTLFLARFADGWRVTAAGCTANGGRPYDCVVAGG